MQTIIKQTEDLTMISHSGITRFQGCQCNKDCSCHENFVETRYEYFTVVRNWKKFKRKTTRHNTLEEANERWDFLTNLR
jgi:hypothetical protein